MADFDSELDVEQNQDKKLILKYWLESKSGPLKFKPVFTVEEIDFDGKAAAGFMRVQPAQTRDGDSDAKTGFVWQLEDNTVKVVVRAYDGLGDQEVDNPQKRVFEDPEDLNVNIALNKGKTVFKVKPAGGGTVADAAIVSFSGVSKADPTQQLPGTQGTWHKMGSKEMLKYLKDGKVFKPRNPVTLSWEVKAANAVLVDLDLRPSSAQLGGLDIPSTEKDRRAYITKLTRDGDGSARLDWKHEHTRAGGGMFVDLNIYDPAKPDKPLATWVVGAYPDYPPPQINVFMVQAPGENQSVKAGGALKIGWELSDTAVNCALAIAIFDEDGKLVDRKKPKSNGDGTLKDSIDFTIDADKAPVGKKIKVQAALLQVKENRGPSIPAAWDWDDSGPLATQPTPAVTISVVAAIVPAKVPPFVYTPIPHGIRNMWIAKEWKISSTTGLTGTQANSIVNQTYEHLNNQLLDYMGGPPFVANWFTFGKWASREAGQGIKNLAAGASAMNDLMPTTLEAALILVPLPTGGTLSYIASRSTQFTVLAKVMADDSGGMLLQVLHLFFTTIGMPVPSPSDVTNPTWQAKFAYNLVKHKGAVGEIFDKMVVLLKVLVHGNQGIYRNMAWATEVFCMGESNGADQGLAKLDEWCGQGPDDPHDLQPRDSQRFLRDSFKMYKDCRDLWVQSLNEPDSTKRQVLLDRRRLLAHAANVTIGCQEQMLILQSPDVFSQQTAQEIVSGQEGVMRLHDPGTSGSRRTIQLLPKGNWADFPQRMGVVPGTGPIQVTVANPYPVPAGATFTAPATPTTYIPRSDITMSSATGTIYEYFFQNVDDNSGGSAKTPLMTVSMTSADWDNVDLYPTAARGVI